jgi:hypothetical protein
MRYMGSRTNQFSLRGLLLAFVAIAFACWLFTVYQWFTPGLRPAYRSFAVIYNCVMATAFGTAIGTVASRAIRCRFDNSKFPSLPGHWLLVLLAVTAMANVVGTAVVCSLLLEDASILYWGHLANWSAPHSAVICQQTLCWSLGAISCWASALFVRTRIHVRWLTLILIAAICASTLSIWNALYYLDVHETFGMAWWHWPPRIYATFMLLGLVALATAATLDCRHAHRTDWTHRTGIVVAFALAVVQITAFIRLR